MTNRTLAVCGGVACLSVLVATDVLAQCGSGYIDLAEMLSRQSVAVVFMGTVTSVERADLTETVTFDVQRRWKGLVKKRATIYRPIPVRIATAEFSPTLFARGESYVVVAHGLSTGSRRELGVADLEDAYGMEMCGEGSRPLASAADDFRRIGPGHAPVDQQPGMRHPIVTPPLKIKDAAPIHPESAISAGIRGTVIVQITVDETGRISRASILRSIRLLDQAAIDCVMKWEYLPALVDDVPQPITTTVAVTFAPS